MSLGLATRGYYGAKKEGVVGSDLVFLYPFSVETRKGEEVLMVVALSNMSIIDRVVLLASGDPTIFSVPATVTILSGDYIATFVGTGEDEGSTVVSATLDSIEKTSDITVYNFATSFNATMTGAGELKAKMFGTATLAAKMISAEEE